MNIRFETPFDQTEGTACGTVTVTEDGADGGDGNGGNGDSEPGTPTLPDEVSPAAVGAGVLVLIILALLVS